MAAHWELADLHSSVWDPWGDTQLWMSYTQTVFTCPDFIVIWTFDDVHQLICFFCAMHGEIRKFLHQTLFFAQWLNQRYFAKPQLERTVFAPDQPLSCMNTFCTQCTAITQVAAGLGCRTSCAAAELFDSLSCTQADVLFVLFNVITQIKVPLHFEKKSISDKTVMHRKWRDLVAAAARLWVMTRAAIMSLDDVNRPKRSDAFALGWASAGAADVSVAVARWLSHLFFLLQQKHSMTVIRLSARQAKYISDLNRFQRVFRHLIRVTDANGLTATSASTFSIRGRCEHLNCETSERERERENKTITKKIE